MAFIGSAIGRITSVVGGKRLSNGSYITTIIMSAASESKTKTESYDYEIQIYSASNLIQNPYLKVGAGIFIRGELRTFNKLSYVFVYEDSFKIIDGGK